jgi:DNA repair protein RecO (recombination protein O)
MLFRLLRETLRAFKAGGDAGLLTAYFEAWYLKISGLLPAFRSCLGCRSDISAGGRLAPHRDGALCGACAPECERDVPEGTARFLEWVRRNPPPRGGDVPFEPEKLAGYRRLLERLIVYHLEQVPQSLRYLANQNNCG